MIASRRRFLFGAAALAATPAMPAIVRAESLMKIIRPTLVTALPWHGDPDYWRDLHNAVEPAGGIDPAAFRRIVEPGLRAAFDETFATEKMAQIARIRYRSLERLARRDALLIDPAKAQARANWRNPPEIEGIAPGRAYWDEPAIPQVDNRKIPQDF